MGSRHPLTWLVIDYLPDHPTLLGAPLAIFGRASYDGDADLLTVSTILATSRPKEVTHVGKHPMQELAKTLLRKMHRGGWVRAVSPVSG